MEKKKDLEFIFEQKNLSIRGDTLYKIASGNYLVKLNTRVIDLAHDLDLVKTAHSVGVVDDEGKIAGIVVRRELFDVLGKPYGQDILKHKTIKKVMREVPVFEAERNILAVAEEIKVDLEKHDVEYYLISTGNKQFAGIFSNIDMMMVLSAMTQSDINLSRNLQKSIVKDESRIAGEGFTIATATRMAKGIGGDYYAVRNYTDNRWLLSLCDVSGKGIPASLITTSISGMHHMADFSRGVPDFLAGMNEYIYRYFETQKFVTGVFADFNPDAGKISLFDMGHSLIYLCRNEKLYRLKTKGNNLPIGVSPEIRVEEDVLNLEKGDLLVLITDGIIEQINSEGEEFGDKRFSRIMKDYRNEDVLKIKDVLFSELLEFRGAQPQHDDMTILLLDYKG